MPVVTRDVKSFRKAGDTKLKGDVTITGGTGITLTQSGQDVTIVNDVEDVVTTKGDIVVATAADTLTRLGVGSNDQVLTADSAEATGVKWAAAGGGGGTDMFDTATATYSIILSPESLSAGTSGTGSLTFLAQGGIRLNTGTTASSLCRVSIDIGWASPGYDQDLKVKIEASTFLISSNGQALVYAISNNANASTATNYAGFRVSASSDTDTAYAASKDGTTEQTTDVTANFGATAGSQVSRNLMVILTAGTNAKFYRDGTLLATHSTNYPPNTDTTSYVLPIALYVDNASDAAQTQLSCSGFSCQITY